MANPLVDPHWLSNHLEEPDLIILDSSLKKNLPGVEPKASGKIPGAKYFDLEGDFSDLNNPLPHMIPSAQQFEISAKKLGINKEHHIIVYDNIGVYTSPRVWWMFKTMGHDKISILNGGLPRWVREGHPVVESFHFTSEQGDFQASLNREALVNLGEVDQLRLNKDYLVVDARSSGRFQGTSPEPRPGLRGGHIPGSVNIPFTEVIDDQGFLPKKNLVEVFEKINPSDKELVFSCGSGVTACVLALAAEVSIPNKYKVFDGSWTAWAMDENLPVQTAN